ncbi:DUF6152 family protein [Phenylobacterium sp. LjRoot225]|uniref:DUF6152 family protein n=1 Tax=Phenylobacterium sp. LjRoot225 TaxID=3342285 RepID=UPI003ECF3E72
MRSLAIAATVFGLLAPTAGFAHHGWSSYDAEKVIKFTAPLTAVSWRNPHGAAQVAYQKQNWTVILAPVARMEARGLTEAMLKPGETVTLEGYPRRDGTTEMRIERITVKGKTVELR